ncbi:MAG: glycosyl hydrolase, partial [candidate division Zixibacteria bacterium]|nr:glycosyl hydrolase [candidate division Zixibacteria bacterium]
IVSGQGAQDHVYRFAWTFPLLLSRYDPNVLYAAGNVIFRTDNEGDSWEAVSPDLTRADISRLGPSGGPITRDATGAETYCTVFALAESPHAPGELWAGTDDGLLHITRDHGKTWTAITPPSLPEWSLIHKIDLSPHTPGKAYVAATRYKLDDYRPYLYSTQDYGKTWRTLSGTFPESEITRVVREDPARAGLLYVGTETGLYFSTDDGGAWQRMESNLPIVPIYDMMIRDNALIVATHGRSFWALDDLSPLRSLDETALAAPAHLFPPHPAYRRWINATESWFHTPGRQYSISFGGQAAHFSEINAHGERVSRMLDAGTNPPSGAVIYYHLNTTENISLTLLDAQDREIKTFTPRPADTPATSKSRYLSVKNGLNRFVWDMRYPNAVRPEGEEEGDPNGMLAVPGRYRVKLVVGETVCIQPLDILPDPRISTTPEQFAAQFALWQRVHDRLSEANTAIDRLRRIRRQTGEWKRRIAEQGDAPRKDELLAVIETLTEKLDALEKTLLQTEGKPGLCRTHEIRDKLAVLIEDIASADAAPTRQMYTVFERLGARLDERLHTLNAIETDDVAALNRLIRDAELEGIA